MFAPSHIHMWKPNPQGDGIWRWGLWEVICHEGGAVIKEISALIKDPRELPHPFPPCKDTKRRWPSTNQGVSLTR